MPMGIGIGLSITLGEGGAFNLEGYLATLAASSYWDFTKTDRHFVENIGPTLASNVGDSIGLGMDSAAWSKRTLAQQLAQGAELVSNPGPFSTTTGYTGVNANLSTSSGNLIVTATSTAPRAVIPITTVVGATYKVTGVVAASTDTGLLVNASNNSDGSANYASSPSTAGAGPRELFFVATATTTYISTRGSDNGSVTSWSSLSVKRVPGNHALQATGSLKPTRQTTGAKFDGADDNLLTSYLAGGGSNFLAGLLTIPATIASTQVIAGLQDGTPSGLSLSVSTGGLIGGRIGTTSLTGSGASDQRGNRVPVAITCDDSAWRLFVGTAQENQGSASGMGTTVPLRLGALNNNGAASAFFGGSIERFVAGRDYLDLSRWLQIRSALLAA